MHQADDEPEEPGPFRVLYFQAKAMRDERRDMLRHDAMIEYDFRRTLTREAEQLDSVMKALVFYIGRDVERFYPKQGAKREHDATI